MNSSHREWLPRNIYWPPFMPPHFSLLCWSYWQKILPFGIGTPYLRKHSTLPSLKNYQETYLSLCLSTYWWLVGKLDLRMPTLSQSQGFTLSLRGMRKEVENVFFFKYRHMRYYMKGLSKVFARAIGYLAYFTKSLSKTIQKKKS